MDIRNGKRASWTTVRAQGKMRFNKVEVAALALGQPSHKFEKEGVLFVREKQEGFFRRAERTSRTASSSSSAAASKTTKKSSARKSLFGCVGAKLSDGVSVERWCRLRGNLLFYFKSRDHWSEPAGVIVVEDCQVKAEAAAPLDDSTFGLVLAFGGGQFQHLATYTEAERDSWMAALRSASHRHMKAHLEELRARLNAKTSVAAIAKPEAAAVASNEFFPVIDPCEVPLCEMSFCCDNLLCDALGRSPSAKIVISLKNHQKQGTHCWIKYSQTEVAEKSSNPVFMRTILFSSNNVNDKSDVKFEAYDMRERYTATSTLLGTAQICIGDLKHGERIRLKLDSPNPDGRTAGFVTVTTWMFDTKIPASTDSTPIHRPSKEQDKKTMVTSLVQKVGGGHKRSHSLPSNIRQKSKQPSHGSLNLLYSNPIVKSFRFHSGLAGDITVQEVMAEPKLCFAFPQQLLSLWICEEKELVHEIAGLGELKSPWHECQMAWLENHLNIINAYSQALECLDNYKGTDQFRCSTDKTSQLYQFAPVNLHLQRMWAENDSLRKSGIYDTFTHGAFTSIPMKSQPGLIKMLKELKAPQNDSKAWCSQSDRLQMAEDTLSAVRRVRREVVDSMRMLMKAAKDKRSDGMFAIIEEMLRKTKCLCNLLDQNLVEEVFAFLEENRVTVRPEKDEFSQSVAEFMQRNKLKIDLPLMCRPKLLGPSLQTPCTEFVAKELRTPEVDLIFSPVTGAANGNGGNHLTAGNSGDNDFWRTYSAYTSGYQSVDRLSDIDEFEESFRYLSVMDKTRHYYTLCRAASPVDTPPATPMRHSHSEGHDEGVPEMEYEDEFAEDESNLQEENDDFEEEEDTEIMSNNIEMTTTPAPIAAAAVTSEAPPAQTQKQNTDQGIVSDTATGLHYKAGDEPEPIDLTHLNIEAAMMCLASKVRLLCGKANSPTLSSRTFRFKELDAKRSLKKSEENFQIPDVPKPSQDIESIEDWAAELRPSMRKLRQGMDSLCKTSKLTCSSLKLRQTSDAVQLSHAIKYRRDVCFSQALTSLVTGLMTRLWCSPGNPEENEKFLKICTQLGPLVAFESLLSVHAKELVMFNDMIVVIEDLRNVEFNLILVDKTRSKIKIKNRNCSNQSPVVPMLEYHSFPLPRITGSRTSLKVLLPVPDYVYTMLPLDQMKTMTFSITPVLFNVGINENATLAHKMGHNGPQEKNNIDNFKTLAEYYRRYKKLDLQPTHHKMSGKRFGGLHNEPDVDDLLNIMKDAVHCKKNKNVDILHLASQICHRLHGLRFTNCKSGKDRTGVAVSLEQIQILSQEYDLAEHEYQKALDAMRSEGTRIENCYKNIGHRKYAFGTLQLATFPYQYRAPVGSYRSNLGT